MVPGRNVLDTKNSGDDCVEERLEHITDHYSCVLAH